MHIGERIEKEGRYDAFCGPGFTIKRMFLAAHNGQVMGGSYQTTRHPEEWDRLVCTRCGGQQAAVVVLKVRGVHHALCADCIEECSEYFNSLEKAVEIAAFLFTPEGRKSGSGAMRELKAAVAAYNEAQASE